MGRLVDLCEQNYELLQRLMPDLLHMRGQYRAVSHDHADLHLDVLEHSRYTSLIHLTYYFEHAEGKQPEPDAVLRVYHDARQLEAVELRQADSVLSAASLYEVPGLLNKWQLNWFVGKWLEFCVRAGYRFSPSESCVSDGMAFDFSS